MNIDMTPRPEAAHLGDPPDVEDAQVDYLAGMFSDVWLMGQTFPPIEYVVPGVFTEGLTFLVSAPKIGKSFMVLGLAVACATGGRAFGQIQVPQRPVLYLAFEDGKRRLQGRKAMMRIPEGIPDLNYIIEPPRPGQGTALDMARQFVEQHADRQPVVFLDTLGKVMPPAFNGESAYERDYRIGSWIKSISDRHTGSSVIVVHHSRKADASDFVDATNGTQGLAGSADAIAVLKRERHQTEGVLQVTGRDVPEGRYAVQFEPETGLWSLDGDDLDEATRNAERATTVSGLGDVTTAIIEYLSETPGAVSVTDVAAAMGLDSHTAGTYLGRLYRAGRVSRPTRAMYSLSTQAPLATPVESVEMLKATNTINTTPQREGFQQSTLSTGVQGVGSAESADPPEVQTDPNQ